MVRPVVVQSSPRDDKDICSWKLRDGQLRWEEAAYALHDAVGIAEQVGEAFVVSTFHLYRSLESHFFVRWSSKMCVPTRVLLAGHVLKGCILIYNMTTPIPLPAGVSPIGSMPASGAVRQLYM